MTLDGKLLSRARAALNDRRRMRESLYARRIETVYAACPRVRELDMQIRATIAGVIAAALKSGGDPEAAVEAQRIKNAALQEERRRELVRAGFREDYLDESNGACSHCGDTGYDGIRICSCLMSLYKREQRESLSSLLILGSESFENFKMSYYSALVNDDGFSDKQMMEVVFETCRSYADKFGSKSVNLFLIGAPGLGKTFLSACIARVVSEKGNSVVYNTASAIFSMFEDVKFSRAQNMLDARQEVRRCLECDLLILDDLGTEMTTQFTISALYELVNTRLITNKKTVISSNHNLAELQKRYSDRIMSRLEGEYHILRFYGSDIRKLKK